MKKTNTFLLYEFYIKFAETISGLRFTHREIDVIACVLYNRGATIPSFLNITPRTVETHKRHIMQKIRCNSREGIIDFIEKSNKHDVIKRYYSMLITQHFFENCLKKIAEMRIKKYPVHLIVNDNLVYQSSFVQAIVKDSRLAGIHIHLNVHGMPSESERAIHNVIVMPAAGAVFFMSIKPTLLEDQLKTAYILFSEAEEEIVLLQKNEGFFFYKDLNTHYYDAFCSLLERLISDVDLTLIFQAFKQHLHNSPRVFRASPIISDKTFCKKSADIFTCNQFVTACKKGKEKNIAAFALILLGAYGVCAAFFYETKTLHSELSLPKSSVFLNRPQLEKQISMIMGAQTGIKKIVIVGIGGSGKTTIVRKYSRSEKAQVIWELNADNSEMLINSLKDFSYALANTKEKKEELAFIHKINNKNDRDNQILMFVKNNLKKSNGWILIFDNVDHFSTIMPYLPQDTNIWGEGKVLITTRNANVENCFYINACDIIHVGELNESEKNKLFSMILFNQDSVPTHNFEQETASFLKNVSSYPLDILTAAYSIKETNATYESYLSGIKNLSADFVEAQASFLVNTCLPSKTRYGMISLALTKLIHTNPIYKDILFFISLMNTQSIPKKVLSLYLENTSIEPFMHGLRGQSLITQDGNGVDVLSSDYFSIHRSLQEAALVFSEKLLTPEKMTILINQFIGIINSFVCSDLEKDPAKMVHFLPHMETMANTLEKLAIPVQKKEKFRQQLFLLLGYAHYKSTHNLQLAHQYFTKVAGIQNHIKALDNTSMAALLKDMEAISVSLNNVKNVLDKIE